MGPLVSVSTFLKASWALIDTESKWARCALAKDKDGRVITPESRFAQTRCAMGALYAARKNKRDTTIVFKAERYLSRAINDGSVSHVNDTGTYAEVKAMYSCAIALAEADEAQGHGG